MRGISEEASDWVVGVTSQAGGLIHPHTSTFNHHHLGVANEEHVFDRCLELLRTDPSAGVFREGFPMVIPRHVSPERNPRDAKDAEEKPSIRLTLPALQEELAPGMEVAMVVERISGEELTDVLVTVPGGFTQLKSSPFVGEMIIPEDVVGSIPLIAVGRHANGTYSKAEILLNVDAGADLLSLVAEAGEIALSRRGVKKRLNVTGFYGGDVSRDLSRGATGTEYGVDNAAVAKVDANGWVSALGSGETTLTITHDGKQVTRVIRVALEPEAQLTVMALSDTGTRGWVGGEDPRVTFMLANTGADPAPNTVVYFTLPAGLTTEDLVLSTGTWQEVGKEVSWVVGELGAAANATITMTLSGSVGHSGQLAVLATSDAPTTLAGADMLSLTFFRDPELRASWNVAAAAPELGWQSETGVTFIIESSSNMSGPWTEVGQHRGDGVAKYQTLPSLGATHGFWRLRLIKE